MDGIAKGHSRPLLKEDEDIDIEAELLGEEELCSIRVSAKNLLREVDPSESYEGGRNLRESVWPALDVNGIAPKPRLKLVPLQRIGAAQGYSGSHVMIGYFVDASKQIFTSTPMVVKISKPSSTVDKLKEEKNNADAIRPYAAY